MALAPGRSVFGAGSSSWRPGRAGSLAPFEDGVGRAGARSGQIVSQQVVLRQSNTDIAGLTRPASVSSAVRGMRKLLEVDEEIRGGQASRGQVTVRVEFGANENISADNIAHAGEKVAFPGGCALDQFETSFGSQPAANSDWRRTERRRSPRWRVKRGFEGAAVDTDW